jgi:hypothetical protein
VITLFADQGLKFLQKLNVNLTNKVKFGSVLFTHINLDVYYLFRSSNAEVLFYN